MKPYFRLVALAASVCLFAGAQAGDDGEGARINRKLEAALAGTYAVNIVGEASNGCRVTLREHAPGMHAHQIPYTMNAACDAYPPLRLLSDWGATGAGSVRLSGGEPYRTLGEFSPVQDASGVYLRGGLGEDGTVYELRPVGAPS